MVSDISAKEPLDTPSVTVVFTPIHFEIRVGQGLDSDAYDQLLRTSQKVWGVAKAEWQLETPSGHVLKCEVRNFADPRTVQARVCAKWQALKEPSLQITPPVAYSTVLSANGPLCGSCGTKMRSAGPYYVCEGCGSTGSS